MKTKAYVLFCALALFATAPVYGQGHHYGRGHGKGNPHSDKGGHDENGSDKSGHDENDSNHEDDYSVLNSHLAGVVSELAIGTLTTAEGAPIPIGSQGKLYVLLTNSATTASAPPAAETVATAGQGPGVAPVSTPTVSAFYMALSAAGAPADAKLVSLIESLSGLSADRVPTAVKNFNEFVAVASPAFLANPPADFLALHAVLAKITVGLTKQ